MGLKKYMSEIPDISVKFSPQLSIRTRSRREREITELVTPACRCPINPLASCLPI